LKRRWPEQGKCSDLPGEPADAADDADLVGGALILRIENLEVRPPHA
jgi:hypothetical protein